MNRISKDTTFPKNGISKKSAVAESVNIIHHLAFDNSLQPNIISVVSSGKIILANNAACKLLGYSKKQILNQTRSTIFDINESSFKKMLKQRTAEGHSKATVTALKKSGRPVPCEITSAVFIDMYGIKIAITTITDIRKHILKQKNIDVKKEKIVTGNIILAQAKSDTRLNENNEWIKYIAKTSYDVMWDWDTVTGKIYVGDSLEEVFGYKIRNNTVDFTDFSRCLLPEEKDIIERKLFKALASGKKGWNDSFMFRRHDGSLAATESRASIIRDELGKAIRLIGAVQDVSRLQELEKLLEDQVAIGKEFNDLFLVATKLSFDGIWEWNLLTNEFFLSEGFEELFGYAIKSNTGDIKTDWSNYIYPDDKKLVEKGLYGAITSSASHWEQAYRFIKADGSVAKVFNRISIIRDAAGKACRMIGVMQDISKQKALEERLEQEMANKGKIKEYEASFKFAFNSSSDILFDSDLLTNQVIISDGYEKEFGYKIASNMTPAEDWVSHIHPDDKKLVMRDYSRMLESDDNEWKYSYRFLRADNSVANVRSSSIVLRNASGKAYRVIGSLHDISNEMILEERLEQEMKLKVKQIADATEDARDTERSDIGKELHDNVNQLLGASRLYLDMAKREGPENSEMYLSRSSEYTLMAIEEIRKLTKGLTTDTIKNLGLCNAIENIAADAMEASKVKISCALKSFTEDKMNDKFKLNVFRIVQEELNNILKHARATKVIISLTQNTKFIILSISDNGIGFDTSKKRMGIGMANIKSRAASFNGTADFVSQPGQGCVLSVIFPVTGTA